MIALPSPVMHYCIANMILQNVKLDRNQFIIGNFAPDAHHQTSEGRRKTHFQRQNLEYDMLAFKNKYMMYEINDFILGYYCHLVADTMSFNNFNLLYLQIESEEEKRNRIKMCYNDYYVLNSKLIEYYQLTEEHISIPKCLLVEEINADRLSYIIYEFQRNFYNHSDRKELLILNIENVVCEINDIAKKCVSDIRNFKRVKSNSNEKFIYNGLNEVEIKQENIGHILESETNLDVK